ncbi:MAG TPA: HEPN domain-containing protein [Candidatus Brocadiales bacterium]|nr:HEPN domain-containing protein [Candidatus Brocadiales bacterium]
MTDVQTLFLYRLKQAEETLSDAERMVQENFSPRSIINRAYYSMFYAVLALFLKTGINIKTSKHIGVISVFEKEFVKTGKINKRYSKILHDAFDDRQEADYKELVEISSEKAAEHVKLAKEFLEGIKEFIDKSLI